MDADGMTHYGKRLFPGGNERLRDHSELHLTLHFKTLLHTIMSSQVTRWYFWWHFLELLLLYPWLIQIKKTWFPSSNFSSLNRITTWSLCVVCQGVLCCRRHSQHCCWLELLWFSRRQQWEKHEKKAGSIFCRCRIWFNKRLIADVGVGIIHLDLDDFECWWIMNERSWQVANYLKHLKDVLMNNWIINV